MSRPPELERIWSAIDRERLVELTVEAVGHYTPSFAEEPVVQVFAEALQKIGISTTRQPVPPDPGASEEVAPRTNLIAELGPAPPALLWVGHLDTIELWPEQSPGASRDDGELWGLGTADMKGGCAAVVEALTALRASEVELRRGLRVAFVVGEEDDGDGARELGPLVDAPLAIVGEPTNLRVCLDQYGYLELRLETRGSRVHAALPEIGGNAVHAMLVWLSHVFERARLLPNPGAVSISLREITGGSPNFVVAEQCETTLDVHLAPGVSPDTVHHLVRDSRAVAADEHPRCRFSVDELSWAPGYALDAGNDLLSPLRHACELAGHPFTPEAFRSHCDASQLYEAGTLPVIVGPGDLAVAHTRDEHVAIAELERAARLYAAVIYAACVAE